MATNLVTNPDGTSSFRDSDNQLNALELDGKKGAYVDPANFVRFYDDFLGDLLDDSYSGNSGSDAQAADPVINAQAGGVVRLVSGDTVTAAESISSLTHGLNWKANQGGLYLKTRIKAVTSAADININVGFTDALASGTLEEPFSISGVTITSNASDAACFVFDTAQTNDAWHVQGVAGDTDTAINNTGIAVTADSWVTLEIEVDTSGNAEFFIDGVSYGTVASAVTATVALTPIILVMARTTTSKTVDVDYLYVAGQRPD